MQKRSVFHIVPNSDNSEKNWKVEKERSERASGLFKIKDEAIDFATELAKNSGGLGQIKIHGRDGKIQEERTYGKDPEKYKG